MFSLDPLTFLFYSGSARRRIALDYGTLDNVVIEMKISILPKLQDFISAKLSAHIIWVANYFRWEFLADTAK